MANAFINKEKTKLYTSESSNKEIIELLWGDQVFIENNTPVNNRYKARVRGLTGYVNAGDIGPDALLELYFIDVGQGDGVLIVTPDRKHILIDGGYKREAQPHGKSAADFVDWKFYKDYGSDTIHLDAMICSHCDADHYGGLWDLLNPTQKSDLETTHLVIDRFYHAGVSRWKDLQGKKSLGKEEGGYMHDLLTDRASIGHGLDPASELQLQGEWADFLRCVFDAGMPVSRLSYNPANGFGYLPGFEANSGMPVKILGPVETTVNGQPKLKDFGDSSHNTNGNSVLLRIDYGRNRILLTGDLNKKSQQYILGKFTGNRQDLAADVVKSCHHGSDDCSYEFLECVQAAATVISSGDDESHSHPRPNIVAAAGSTGYRKIYNDELITPLIFSTEISRSVKMGDPDEVDYKKYTTPQGDFDITLTDEAKTRITYTRTASGSLTKSRKVKPMGRLKVIDGIVYGLVNVRTDGNKVLCATLNEGKYKWEIKTFESRF